MQSDLTFSDVFNNHLFVAKLLPNIKNPNFLYRPCWNIKESAVCLIQFASLLWVPNGKIHIYYCHCLNIIIVIIIIIIIIIIINIIIIVVSSSSSSSSNTTNNNTTIIINKFKRYINKKDTCKVLCCCYLFN